LAVFHRVEVAVEESVGQLDGRGDENTDAAPPNEAGRGGEKETSAGSRQRPNPPMPNQHPKKFRHRSPIHIRICSAGGFPDSHFGWNISGALGQSHLRSTVP
jgi:hypothetical protein